MSIADKLVTLEVNTYKVYYAGFVDGEKQGYNSGYEKGEVNGQKAEYDRFWDAFQDYGNRTSYGNTFSKSGWNDVTFKPKYPINAKGDASYMFADAGFSNFDFVESGIELETEEATSLTYCFREVKGITRLGKISCLGCKDLNRLFYRCFVKTIELFVVHETLTYSATFGSAHGLENIRINGTIGTSIDFTSSPLTVDSMKSVISCLKNYAGTENENVYKVAFNSDCWTALEASGTAPDGNTWVDYVNYTLGWNT